MQVIKKRRGAAKGEEIMKKVLCLVLAAVFAFAPTAAFADSSAILINGEKAVIAEGMGSVVNRSDRTFVPIRFALEYFGYDVTWSDEDKLVLGRSTEGDVFIMQVGSPLLFFKPASGGDKTITMDVEPFLNDAEGRTYIPLRFLAEVLEYNVGYDDATGTVTLDK